MTLRQWLWTGMSVPTPGSICNVGNTLTRWVQRPGMLLNTLQFPGQPPQVTVQPQTSVVPRLKNPALSSTCGARPGNAVMSPLPACAGPHPPKGLAAPLCSAPCLSILTSMDYVAQTPLPWPSVGEHWLGIRRQRRERNGSIYYPAHSLPCKPLWL